MSYKKPKGTYDVLPTESIKWQNIENLIRDLCTLYNYKEIRTPMFESSDIFHRSAGETSDIVSKETYDFVDRGGRDMSLRPEGTAGVVRSYVENKLYADHPVSKLYYIGPMFRYERQQKGRYRQHTQFGVEVLGSEDPSIDAEVISLAVNLYKVLGLKNITVKLNTLGDEESRNRYREVLVNHLNADKESLCSDCQVRLEKNPLRVLDCKVDRDKEIMKNIPEIVDHLTDEAREYFNKVKLYLEALDIEYVYDANLVRGFDYYTHTIFEVQAEIEGFGSQNTLCGGGRYNNLVETLNGPKTPGIGFGMGLERLLLALEAEQINIAPESYIDLFLITIGDEAKFFAMGLQNELRMRGLIVDTDYNNKNMKGQFKQADRLNARFIGILGEDEIREGSINIKNNATGEQQKVHVSQIIDYLVEEQMKQHDAHSHSCCGGHGHGEDHECCGGHNHDDGHECSCGHDH